MDLLKEGASFRPPLPDKCECIIELVTKSTNIVPAVIDAIQKSSEQNIVHDGQYVGFVRLVVVTEQQLIDYNWKRINRMAITVAFSPTGMPLTATAAYRLSSPIMRDETNCSAAQFKALRLCQKTFNTLVFTYPQVVQLRRQFEALKMAPILQLMRTIRVPIDSQIDPRPIPEFGFHESLAANKAIAQSCFYLDDDYGLIMGDMDKYTMLGAIIGNFAAIEGIRTGQAALDVLAAHSDEFVAIQCVCVDKAGPKHRPLDNAARLLVHWLLLAPILHGYSFGQFKGKAIEVKRHVEIVTKSRTRWIVFSDTTSKFLKTIRKSKSVRHILPTLMEPFFDNCPTRLTASTLTTRLYIGQMLCGPEMDKFEIIDEFLDVPATQKTKAHVHPKILKEIEVYTGVKAKIWSELNGTNYSFKAYCLFRPDGHKLFNKFSWLSFCADSYKNKMNASSDTVAPVTKGIKAELLALLEQSLESSTDE